MIGPARGLDNLADPTPQARTFVDIFYRTFAQDFAPDMRVVLDESGALECVLRATPLTPGTSTTPVAK